MSTGPRFPWWGLLLIIGFAPGCDPNPNGPRAVPPPASQSTEATPKARPDSPLIDRD